MGRFKEYESIVMAKELAEKYKAIEDSRQQIVEAQVELDLLNKEQEKKFMANRVGAIALKALELKALKAETDRVEKLVGTEGSTLQSVLDTVQRKEFISIRREHADLDKERKACLDALKAYKKANEAYKAKTRKLVEEYGEDWAEATGWIKPNPNRNTPDYHVQFGKEIRKLFKE